MTVGIMRFFNLSLIGDRAKVVDPDRLDKVFGSIETMSEKLEERFKNLERRVADVESGLSDRPSRAEMHKIQLDFSDLKGRLGVMESVGQQTNAAVQRIEGYMFEYGVNAGRHAGRKGD
ncbi:DUF2730 family protein [Fulvimarina endophytica]|nr:DUF2730 family protein [Fulvimarina endophytica]